MTRCGRSFALPMVIATALTCGSAPIASAEVQVQGGPAAVRITTSRDAIVDVLSALGTSYNVRYRSAVPLDAAANATYSGSITRVIADLLDGYNYVVKTDQEKTEIVVLGKRGDAAVLPPPAKAPAPKGILSRWR